MVRKMNDMKPQWRAAVETLIVVIFWVSCVCNVHVCEIYFRVSVIENSQIYLLCAVCAPRNMSVEHTRHMKHINGSTSSTREWFLSISFFHCVVRINQYPATNFRRFRGGEWASARERLLTNQIKMNEALNWHAIVCWQYRTIHRICIMWFHSISPKNLLFIQLNDGGGGGGADGVDKKK